MTGKNQGKFNNKAKLKSKEHAFTVTLTFLADVKEDAAESQCKIKLGPTWFQLTREQRLIAIDNGADAVKAFMLNLPGMTL